MLKKALAISREIHLNELSEPDETHVFSARFEKKMNKLVKSEKRVYYPLVNSPRRRIAVSFALVIILSMTMVMSVSAFREGIFEMVQQIFDKFSIITYEEKSDNQLEVKPFVEYELTNVPEGYFLEEEHVTPEAKMKAAYYKNDKDINTIAFNQYPIENVDFMINTEGVALEEHYIYEQTVNYYSNLGIQNIFWDNGEYAFLICGEIDKNILLDLVKYIKIKE